jgi:hypothetical protein
MPSGASRMLPQREEEFEGYRARVFVGSEA